MYGDYTQYRKWNTSRVKDDTFAAADANKTLLAVKSVNHQLFIQKITYVSKTAAAQVITLQDSNGTPLFVGSIAASLAVGTNQIVCDYGPQGKPLTVGKDLVTANTAGPAGEFHIEAYEKINSGAINTGTAATGQ